METRFTNAGLSESVVDRDVWCWLAAALFEKNCPAGHGRWQPGERARWVLESNDYRRYYRHLLAGPYMISRAHRDDPARALGLLANPLTKPGEGMTQAPLKVNGGP
jgi:hypothetical protein